MDAFTGIHVALADEAQANFLMSIPEQEQTDPSISTE